MRDHLTPTRHIYQRNHSIVFLKTHEAFGGLSNMASGFPVDVNGVSILTSEALYQACRFPHWPDIQRKIIDQASPMAAKMVSKPYRKEKTRSDWDEVNVEIMSWCLHIKLAQNWRKFGQLLLDTEHRDIVEESRRDVFWGAKPIGENLLEGVNYLGCLLTELREQLRKPGWETLRAVKPLQIKDFLLFGTNIELVTSSSESDWRPDTASPLRMKQSELFDTQQDGVQ